MFVKVVELEKDKLLEYQTEVGSRSKVTCTAEGATATAQGILKKLGATSWEIQYAGSVVSQGRRTLESPW